MIKNVHWSLWKIHVIPVRFQWILNFLVRFSINTQISNFMKIRPVGAELSHADRWAGGQTGLPKLTVDFRNYAKAPKNCTKVRQWISSLHTGEQMNTNDCFLCMLPIRNLNTFQPFSRQRTCRSSGRENLTYHSGDSGSIPGEFAWGFSAIFFWFFVIIIVRPLLLGLWNAGYISDRH
jgi:hypothetical protein